MSVHVPFRLPSASAGRTNDPGGSTGLPASLPPASRLCPACVPGCCPSDPPAPPLSASLTSSAPPSVSVWRPNTAAPVGCNPLIRAVLQTAHSATRPSPACAASRQAVCGDVRNYHTGPGNDVSLVEAAVGCPAACGLIWGADKLLS
ncbi:hypothetical protein PICMEDRAFT_114110 [Pichia membranifaciens NRRL Y-2026]|uniref:Uncharacterized protein n=1 Tax=Pichia membranifaciens NRRL Y-2026 TaxID=763406 RepID=A0A1E3NPK5_9ASCO|nr:hypothetical protein PICMEDRAFT_114110 [Pichia membranifaciens NRRL Y-2026]ODQ47483.1 hypothetical protein PICMEDRAFT_114110 [Pichia membranifaciens NRRL Y-2026]